jgi:hypothetical protein
MARLTAVRIHALSIPQLDEPFRPRSLAGGVLRQKAERRFQSQATRDERGNWRFATEVRREQAPKPRMISKNMESADRFFEGGPMKKALLSGIGISILMTSVGLTVQRNRAGNGARGSIVAVNDPMRPIKLPPPPTPTTSTTPRLANAHSASGTLVVANDPMRPIKLPPPPSPTSPINPPAAPRLTAA